MQPNRHQVRGLRAELNVSNDELSRRTKWTRTDRHRGERGYGDDRIARVLNGGEKSQPLLNAVYAALRDIRDERSRTEAAQAEATLS